MGIRHGADSGCAEDHHAGRTDGQRSKGRAITGEEFDRMLAAVPKVIGDDPAIVETWKRYLRGLWLSGLRLGESLELYWDRDDRLCVDLSGKRPMLRIPAPLEKGKQDRQLPIAPDFFEFLQEIPEAERTGRVFRPGRRCHTGERLVDDRIGRLVSKIGEKAGVKVWTHPVSGNVKYASAHDLRRSFGFRWAMKVMPAVLQQMMRHENIDTTMEFYVGRDAEATADEIWQAYGRGNSSGNTASKSSEIPVKK
jgi:integrase